MELELLYNLVKDDIESNLQKQIILEKEAFDITGFHEYNFRGKSLNEEEVKIVIDYLSLLDGEKLKNEVLYIFDNVSLNNSDKIYKQFFIDRPDIMELIKGITKDEISKLDLNV